MQGASAVAQVDETQIEDVQGQTACPMEWPGQAVQGPERYRPCRASGPPVPPPCKVTCLSAAVLEDTYFVLT